MPPKKKKAGAVIDGVDTTTMTREQLEKFAQNLRNEMEREREERNFFQLERDKLRTFWEITRNQLEDARLQICSKEREVEVAQEMAEMNITHTTHRMKHLRYENQTRIGEIRAEAMTQLKASQEDHALQELDLLQDKRELRQMLREKEEFTELQVQTLKMRHAELLSQEHARFSREAAEMTVLHEQKLANFVEEAENRHRMEMFEVEERKSTQIQNLIQSHERAFKEMRNYYNDITLNNLALISTLKEQIEELKQPAEKNEKVLNEMSAENRRLSENLGTCTVELQAFRKKLENFDRDRAALIRSKAKLSTTLKDQEKLKWETEALRMLTQKLTEERDELRGKFEAAVLEIQQKTGLKNVLLERKLAVLKRETEKREVVLGEMMTAAGTEPQNLSKRMEKLLKTKNEKIQSLRYELARVCKAHNDLLATYEAKLEQFGIPKDELGFQPIRVTGYMKLSAAPAGLVAKQTNL